MKESNVEISTEETYIDLLPGFCAEIPDLSLRVWMGGMAKTISMHYGQDAISNNTLILNIFRPDGNHFALAVPKLVICAFKGVGLERIESVECLDRDYVNCSLKNLQPVYADEPKSEKAATMLHRVARAEGLKLAREVDFPLGNPFDQMQW